MEKQRSHRDDGDLSGIDAVTSYLDGRGVAYEVLEHEQTFTAVTEARAAGISPTDVAKTIVLRDQDGYRLAVIAACDHLDLRKVRAVLAASAHLRLATEQEMAQELGPFEVGSTPPFGDLLAAPEVVDRHLLEHKRILCSGGDHRHSVLVDPSDMMRLARPQVADICED